MGYTTDRKNPKLALAKRTPHGLVPVGLVSDGAVNQEPPANHDNFILFIKRGAKNGKRDQAVLLIHRLLHEVFPSWTESRVQVMSELMYDNLQERDKSWLASSLEKQTVETNLDDLGFSDWPGFEDGEEVKW